MNLRRGAIAAFSILLGAGLCPSALRAETICGTNLSRSDLEYFCPGLAARASLSHLLDAASSSCQVINHMVEPEAAACPAHAQFNARASGCELPDMAQPMRQMVVHACAGYKNKVKFGPVPEPLPLVEPCENGCTVSRAMALSTQAEILRQDIYALRERFDRLDFIRDVASESIGAYLGSMRYRCAREPLGRMVDESVVIADHAQAERGELRPELTKREEAFDTVLGELNAIYAVSCPKKEKNQFCNNLAAVIELNTPKGALSQAYDLFFAEGDGEEKAADFSRLLEEHPATKFECLDRSGICKMAIRQMIASFGLTPDEEAFLQSMFSEQTTSVELEGVVSAPFIRLLMGLKDAGAFQRLQMYAQWTKENASFSKAFDYFVVANADLFRRMAEHAVRSNAGLTQAQRDLILAILSDPALQSPTLILAYRDLVLNLASVDTTADPFGYIKELGAFTWNPENKDIFNAGKRIVTTPEIFLKIKAVAKEAIRAHQDKIFLKGKPLPPELVTLSLTLIEHIQPDYLGAALDYAIRVAEEPDLQKQMLILQEVAAHPEKFGLTETFITASHSVIRAAALASLENFHDEMVPEFLQECEYKLLWQVVYDSTPTSLATALNFMSQLAGTTSNEEATALLKKMASNPARAGVAESFLKQPGVYDNVTCALMAALDRFEPDLVAAGATPSQVYLVRTIIDQAELDHLLAVMDFSSQLFQASNEKAQFQLIKKALTEPKVLGVATKFIDTNEILIQLVIDDTLKSILETPDGPASLGLHASQVQMALLINEELESGSLSNALTYVERYLRAGAEQEKLDIILEVLAKDKVKDAAKGIVSRAFPTVRAAALHSLQQLKPNLLGENGEEKKIGAKQFALLYKLIDQATATQLKAAIDFVNKVAKAQDPTERAQLFYALAEDGGAMGVAKELIHSDFELVRGSLLETVEQFRPDLLAAHVPASVIDLGKLAIPRSPAGLEEAVGYGQELLRAYKTGGSPLPALQALLGNRSVMTATHRFVTDNLPAVRTAVLDVLRSPYYQEKMHKQGVTAKQIALADAVMVAATATGAGEAVNFVHYFTKQSQKKYSPIAILRAFSKARPQAGEGVARLMDSKVFPALKAALEEFILLEVAPGQEQRELLAVARNLQPSGVQALLAHRALLLDAVATMPEWDIVTGEQITAKVKEVLFQQPQVVRALVQQNMAAFKALASEAAVKVAKIEDPKKILEAKMTLAFIRGLTGTAKMKDPDPDRWGPLLTYGLANLIKELRLEQERRIASLPRIPDHDIVKKIQRREEVLAIVLQGHAHRIMEFAMERLGVMVASGSKMKEADVKLVLEVLGQIELFAEHSEEKENSLRQLAELKRAVGAYARVK